MISIHALREEGDAPCGAYCRPQSISIHALREEGDAIFGPGDERDAGISIHALREEGDGQTSLFAAAAAQFLSTPSARRATRRRPHDHHRKGISIHALREEGDGHPVTKKTCLWDFYPRPPRGGRPRSTRSSATPSLFLSTPSARRATQLSRASGN